MKLRGLVPIFCIHVSVNDLYLPAIGPPILLHCVCGPIVGIYKSLTDIWIYKLGTRFRIFDTLHLHCSTFSWCSLTIVTFLGRKKMPPSPIWHWNTAQTITEVGWFDSLGRVLGIEPVEFRGTPYHLTDFPHAADGRLFGVHDLRPILRGPVSIYVVGVDNLTYNTTQCNNLWIICLYVIL